MGISGPRAPEILGVGSVTNIPVVFDFRCVGTINLLHKSGWYRVEHIPLVIPFSGLLIPLLTASDKYERSIQMDELRTGIVFTFVSIFSMVNPIGMAPVFLDKTRNHTLKARHLLAYKVALYGTLLLVATLFVGPYVLRFFGISLPDLEVAGGIFIFYTAWGMLVAQPPPPTESVQKQPANDSDIAFFPLTMPITAGAGSLAITISLSSKILHSATDQVAGYTGAIIGICLVFLTVAVCYRFADTLFTRLGTVGTTVITRLTAFFLLAIGVEVIWGGLRPLILSLSSK